MKMDDFDASLQLLRSDNNSYYAPEYREKKDNRSVERRNSLKEIDFEDRRKGDRRKFNRRTRAKDKTFDLIRILKHNDLYPYEKVYDQPDGVNVIQNGNSSINLSLVDYYNFGQHDAIKDAACQAIMKYGGGALSARHSYGYLTILKELEQSICRFMGKKKALIFNSGYMANLAAIDSLTGRDASIFIDQQSHISLYHASRLSQKKTYRYVNNDMNHLERFLKIHQNDPNKWIVTLGVFSHTGVLGNLHDIVFLSKKYKARIFIDDAHGVGIYGKNLRGVADHYNVNDDIDLIMCSFQMAFGNIGAFIVGREYLLNPAHVETLPYVFTYALPPVNTASIQTALNMLQNDGKRLNEQLWNNVNYLKGKLTEIGFKVISPEGHIISFHTGNELKTCEFAKFLLSKGIWVQTYFHPYAPKGDGLIRITCSYEHNQAVLEKTIPIFREAYKIIE